MKRHEHVLKTYKRNHKGDNFRENEESKIAKEKRTVKKLERQSDELIRMIEESDDYDSAVEMYDEISYKAKKVKGNSNTHKKRLKELKKNDDFE